MDVIWNRDRITLAEVCPLWVLLLCLRWKRTQYVVTRRRDSSTTLALWCYISHVFTYLLTYLLRPQFALASRPWKQTRSTWNFSTKCKNGLISHSNIFWKYDLRRRNHSFLLPQHDTPCHAVGLPAHSQTRSVGAGTLQWRHLRDAVACTAAGPGRAVTSPQRIDRLSPRKKL